MGVDMLFKIACTRKKKCEYIMQKREMKIHEKFNTALRSLNEDEIPE